MNEAESAGGQRGLNQALPAATEAQALTISNTTVQFTAGSHAANTPMSRSSHEIQQNLEQQQQQQVLQTSSTGQRQPEFQQMQPAGTPTSSSLSVASSKSYPHQQQQQQQLLLQQSQSLSHPPVTFDGSGGGGGHSSSETSHVNIPANVCSVQQQLPQGNGNRVTVAVPAVSSGCSGSSEANNALTATSVAYAGRTAGSAQCGAVAGNAGLSADSGVVLAPGASEEVSGIAAAAAASTFVVGSGSITPSGSVTAGSTLYVKTGASALPLSSAVGASGTAGFAVSAAAAAAAASGGVCTGSVSPTASRKRIKLEAGIDVEHDISALKKLILEHKYMRLRSIKDRHSEHVAELFFLQTGGSMMEYPVWRKKPATPAFTNFIRTFKLEPLSSNLEEAGEALKQQAANRGLASSSSIGSNNLGAASNHALLSSGNGSNGGAGNTSASAAASFPQGAEIKIPGIGATPVAVSTTLPAAVAQLSQQGGTPIIPDPIGMGATGTTTTGVAGSLDRTKFSLAASGGTVGGAAVGGLPLAVKNELLDARSGTEGRESPLSTNTHSGTNGPISITHARTGAGSNSGSGSGSRLSSHQTLNAMSQQNGAIGGYGNSASSGSSGTSTNGNGQDQYTNKAKQEVYVMQRVQELQKEGLWTERRLPKVQEPQRPKAHWDYLLEEMVWLAADFAQERKWKKAAAKKCARMVQKHFAEKAMAAQRAEKAQELQLKRIAAFVAKEIKIFWSNVEKLVEYKQQTKLDEKRKKALDQQLSFIVDQTERYSQQLVEGMNKSVVPAAAPPADSLNSSRIASPLPGQRRTGNRAGGGGGSDDEFCPEEESSGDDEETIAKAEAEAGEGTKDEVAALQKESEMDLDDFLRDLPKGYLENRDKIVLSEREDSDEGGGEEEEDNGRGGGDGDEELEEGDKDFSADEDSTDDEDTIREQEKKEKGEDHKKELDELNADNEMSIEELIAKYKNLPPAQGEKMDLDSDDDDEVIQKGVGESKRRGRTRKQATPSESTASEADDASDDDEEEEEEEAVDDDDDLSDSEGLTGSEDDEEGEDETEMDADEEDKIGLKDLLDDDAVPTGSGKSHSEKDDMLNDAAAIAESIQPKGNTLSSTSVVTPIPFLLKHSLREYQHIGLDWLVTMHDRKLNGILADEMGLGKTIQTISLLAHLACVKGNWGPHLIIVPSSVMLNWEMEFKKWCPGFKILTYYGTPKERKLKRTGWTKVNAFHVCITSYKLVIQDHQSFRRKKWKYLILDEAQNIKNFKSQRWQLLLNFQTEQRLLLTGTPLQNNLMELWSLMHFLMPHVFQSHREFKEWFSNPMTGMIEGNSEYNDTIIKRLHKVLRPFLLRRLKSEVEKQMPKKYEHVVMCRLSKRQRFLYDDFMSRAKTRETLASGNLLSVINVLMQLRKVCNHPNMFEERPTISPFRMEGISFKAASLVYNMCNYDPFTQIDLSSVNLVLVQLELVLSAYVAHRSQRLRMPRRLIEEIDSTPLPPPRCPTGKLRLHVRVPQLRVQESLAGSGGMRSMGVPVGTSPAMKTEGTTYVPIVNEASLSLDKKSSSSVLVGATSTTEEARRKRTSMMMLGGGTTGLGIDSTAAGNSGRGSSPGILLRKRCDIGSSSNVLSGNAVNQQQQQQQQTRHSSGQIVQIIPSSDSSTVHTPTSSSSSSSSYIITGRMPAGSIAGSNQITTLQRSSFAAPQGGSLLSTQRHSSTPRSSLLPTAAGGGASATRRMLVQSDAQQTQISSTLAATIMQQLRRQSYSSNGGTRTSSALSGLEYAEEQRRQRERTEFYLASIEESRKERRNQILELLAGINEKRCDATPIFGEDLRESLCALVAEEFRTRPELIPFGVAGAYYIRKTVESKTGSGIVGNAKSSISCWSLSAAIKTIDERAEELRSTISNFVIFVPAVCAPTPCLLVSHPHPSRLNAEREWEETMAEKIQPAIKLLHPIISAMSTQFPDPRLIQYDCGKLQTLDRLLKKLKSGGHRVLIFTQMTRMLDVLEAFLNFHGHIYLRLDGTTKVEQRQVLMERFNNDRRMFVFILSTRSGGVGINLTGADTVIFYDSDWNPTMDAQAQDRCHRIGQTRDVHIYRLVSEKTIEENILKKANQKRILGDLAIEGGNFTTAYFKSSTTVQDLFTVDNAEDDASTRLAEVLDRDRERKERLNANLTVPAASSSATATVEAPVVVDGSKSAINVFESALAAAEDDQDVQAAKFAKAEASADLDEFDENIPIDEDKMVSGGGGDGSGDASKEPELSKAEKEVQNLIKQLSPIERYAMRFVEDTEGTWTEVQLKAMEQEFEQKKREWEANQLAERKRMEEEARQREAEEHADLLTFSREDAKNQVNKTHPTNKGGSGSGRRGREISKRLHRHQRDARTLTKTTTTTTTTIKASSSRSTVLNKGTLTKERGSTTRDDRRAMAAHTNSKAGHENGGESRRRTRLSVDSRGDRFRRKGVDGSGSALLNNSRSNGDGRILEKRKLAASGNTTNKRSMDDQQMKRLRSNRSLNVSSLKGSRKDSMRSNSLSKLSNETIEIDSEEDDEEEQEDESAEVSDADSNEYKDLSVSISDNDLGDGFVEEANAKDDDEDEDEQEQEDEEMDVTVRTRRQSTICASPRKSKASGVRSSNSPHKDESTVANVIDSKLKRPTTVVETIKSNNRIGNHVGKQQQQQVMVKSSSRFKPILRHSSGKQSAAGSGATTPSDTRPPSEQRERIVAGGEGTSSKAFDEFDSECSLDVMIDSNDAPDSDSNQMNLYYSNAATGVGGGPGVVDDEDAVSGETGGELKPHNARPVSSRARRRSRDGRSKTPVAASAAMSDLATPDGADDEERQAAPTTTPRTRSRGTVKINLWTLDDSPMLPVFNKRAKSKTPQQQQQALVSEAGNDSDHDENDQRSSRKGGDGEPAVSDDDRTAKKESDRKSVSNSIVENHTNAMACPGDVPSTVAKKEKPAAAAPPSSGGGSSKPIPILKDLKVLMSDMKHQPISLSVADRVSDGFRTPTPTPPKLRRLRRLSHRSGAGSSNNPSAAMTSNTSPSTRTLDSWLEKGATTISMAAKRRSSCSHFTSPATSSSPFDQVHSNRISTGGTDHSDHSDSSKQKQRVEGIPTTTKHSVRELRSTDATRVVDADDCTIVIENGEN